MGGGNFNCDAVSPDGSNSLLNIESPREESRIDFAGPVSAVSVDIGDFNADPDTLFVEAFNSDDVLIDSDSLLIDASFIGMETLSVSGSNIAYIITGARAPALNGASVFIDNIAFTPQEIVAGELIPMDSTALFLAGLSTSAVWMIPTLAGLVGTGISIAKLRGNKN